MRMKERERESERCQRYHCSFICMQLLWQLQQKLFTTRRKRKEGKAQEKNNRTKNMRNAAAAFFKQRREMRFEFRPSEKPFASADTVHRGVGVGGVGVGNWPACHLAHAEQRQVMNGRHSQSSLSYCSHNDNCRHRHQPKHRHRHTVPPTDTLQH